MWYHLTTVKTAKLKKKKPQETTDVGEDVEKKEHLCTVGGNANCGNNMDIPQKVKNRTILWSSNHTTEYLPKIYKNTNAKGYTHPHFYGSIIYNSQDMEASQMPISWWIDKEDVVHIYNGLLFSHRKNEVLPFAMTWVELESIMLS